ncbi:hypothetical protein BDW02DRAFT_643608, partial [Decorospora gaudefroyi]
MPLLASRAAPGSPYRLKLGRSATRLPTFWHHPPPPAAARYSRRDLSIALRRHEALPASHTRFTERPVNTFPRSSGAPAASDLPQPGLATTEDEHVREHGRFRPQLSRNSRRALRQSRPAMVLQAISGPARNLYFIAPPGKTDSSYRAPRKTQRPKGRARRDATAIPSPSAPWPSRPEPVSLSLLLARYLKLHTASHPTDAALHYRPLELNLLRSRAYTPQSIERWASCLVEPRSNVAAKTFGPRVETPPLFLLLLFLRRKHLTVVALGVVMRHIDQRAKAESISWPALKIIAIRLLRHARISWPEAIPYIAAFFAAQARRLHHHSGGSNAISRRVLADMTHFCNTYLALLSLPTTARPVVCAALQEKAQFQILEYMARSSPAVVVTRLGFQSVARNQLAHAKTPQEREWAELKGPSWPPWRESRTAMDEDKSYDFGASRASMILHRMYEAGYSGGMWEHVAHVYAGWDTDSSPTIQTRTSLPRLSAQNRHVDYLHALLWAGRIRTTRTRREAWACFLSSESPAHPAHPEIYLAMFEKLYYGTLPRSSHVGYLSETSQHPENRTTDLLPGDMKEVLPDPSSSLHLVYLSEPVPNSRQLLQRMYMRTDIKPSNRLLAFLLLSSPDFDMVLDLLATAKHSYNGEIGRILSGEHDSIPDQPIPGYLFAAIIRALCRFGHLHQPLPDKFAFMPPEQHAYHLKLNRQYLVEYAYMLLRHYRPMHRPAWATLMDKLLRTKGCDQVDRISRYRLICDLLEHMEQIELDVDDDIFRLVCMAHVYAAQAINQGAASIEDARHVRLTGSRRLRTLFHGLVGTNADMQSHRDMDSSVPPRIPGPAELHEYVRALGILRDYEGLYSLSTWLTRHHAEVTTRAAAQRGGRAILFRTLVALRLAVEGDGSDRASGAPEDIALLVKSKIESVEEWGGWPAQEYVVMYIKGHLKTASPSVGGR